jgi:hypothetical protein
MQLGFSKSGIINLIVLWKEANLQFFIKDDFSRKQILLSCLGHYENNMIALHNLKNWWGNPLN